MTKHPVFDFETYSEAGFLFNEELQKWKPTRPGKPGIKSVGSYNYARHKTTEVLCMSYDMRDGRGRQIWSPASGDSPDAFLDYVKSGGIVEAWNSPFEYYIWIFVCVRLYGWPTISYKQLRDCMARSQAFSLPAKLSKCSEALKTKARKMKEGERLIKIFTQPRSPTKSNPKRRITHKDKPIDWAAFCLYCMKDVETTVAISEQIPELSVFELEVWLLDQKINYRGIQVDEVAIAGCVSIINQVFERYSLELDKLTTGLVLRLPNFISQRN